MQLREPGSSTSRLLVAATTVVAFQVDAEAENMPSEGPAAGEENTVRRGRVGGGAEGVEFIQFQNAYR